MTQDPNSHARAAAVDDLKPRGGPGLGDEAFSLPGCVETPCQLDWRIWGGIHPHPTRKAQSIVGGTSGASQLKDGHPCGHQDGLEAT